MSGLEVEVLPNFLAAREAAIDPTRKWRVHRNRQRVEILELAIAWKRDVRSVIR
jgi:hypothetical protein